MRTRSTAVKEAIAEAVSGIQSDDLIATMGEVARSSAVPSCVKRALDLMCRQLSVLLEEKDERIHLWLERTVKDLRENTVCTCWDFYTAAPEVTPKGFTVVVAILQNMTLLEEQRDRISISAAASAVTDSLLKQHSSICGCDVAIFVSADDRTVWTSLGLAATRYLTHDAIREVSLRTELYFKKDNFFEGLQFMIDSYATLLKGRKLGEDTDENVTALPLWWIYFITVCVSAVLLVILCTGLLILFFYGMYFTIAYIWNWVNSRKLRKDE